MIEIKERPILFNGAMVRAILEGRKTQTRRIVKPQDAVEDFEGKANWVHDVKKLHPCEYACSHSEWALSPYGQPGNRLWVRESFAAREQFPPPGQFAEKVRVAYRAGGEEWFPMEDIGATRLDYDGNWFPSIHMPRWASRILLEITDVRVERLQEMTNEDAYAEGVEDGETRFPLRNQTMPLSKHAFAHLWDSIYRENNWSANPWVWVIEFKRVT